MVRATVGGDQAGAVPARQIGLEGLLHPVLTHLVVPVVVAVGRRIAAGLPGLAVGGVEGGPLLLVVDGADPAQDVGSGVGVILPVRPAAQVSAGRRGRRESQAHRGRKVNPGHRAREGKLAHEVRQGLPVTPKTACLRHS